MEIKREWTLVAPLGELPDRATLKKVEIFLEKDERRYRKRTLLGAFESYALVVKNALESVKATEGVLSFQRDGGGLPERLRGSSRFIGTSVLAVVGVHGERSLYVLQYGREDMWVTRGYTQGRIPNHARDLLAKLHKNPEARRELEVLEGKLSGRYPALKAALERLEGQERPSFLEAVERGQLLFLVAQTGEITHALVGTSLVSLSHHYRMDWREETLLDTLRREDSLSPLSPELLKALLRGRGDVEEAERRLALARLAEL